MRLVWLPTVCQFAYPGIPKYTTLSAGVMTWLFQFLCSLPFLDTRLGSGRHVTGCLTWYWSPSWSYKIPTGLAERGLGFWFVSRLPIRLWSKWWDSPDRFSLTTTYDNIVLNPYMPLELDENVHWPWGFLLRDFKWKLPFLLCASSVWTTQCP